MKAQHYLLVSAHHCAPDMGSEHAVGWNLVSRLARRRAILLITQDNEYRAAVEQGIAKLRAEGCEIHAYFVHHGSRTDGLKNSLRLGYYLTYVAYQWRVYKLAQQLVKQYPVVAVHHLNIVGFREPGFLWQLGLPFIWGPVGGLVFTPWSLYPELPPKMRAFLCLTELITQLQFGLSLRVRRAYQATQAKGGAFIAATPDIGRRFQSRFGGRVQWIPETGANLVPKMQLARPGASPSAPLRLLWVGALIDRKPLGMLLDAIAAVPGHAGRLALTVVGDGESRPRFEAQAQCLGLGVSFLGWQSHADTQAHFQNADLFILLSAKDLTTNVVFEALAHALPVLCLNHHGYADVVEPTCGIKVPISSGSQMRADIARQLDRLAHDRTPLVAMSARATERAAMLSWDRNARAIEALLPQAT